MKRLIFTLLGAFLILSIQAQLAWLRMADFPGTGKHGVASFSINSKGYMGLGADSLNNKSNDWYEYDPINNIWIAKAAFPGIGRAYCVSFNIGAKGYVATGQLISGSCSELWEYDPIQDSWTQKASMPGSARMNAAGFSANGKGYVGTGFIGGQVTSDFYEYNPATNSWSARAPVPGPTRNGAAGFSAGNKGYIGMGGSWNTVTYYKDLYEYNPAIDSWVAKASFPLPYINNPVSYSSTLSGYVLAGYFYQYSGITHNPMNMLYKYDPSSDLWSLEGTLPGLPRGYAGGFTLTNDIYIGAGGSANTPDNGPVITDFWKLSNGLTLMINPGDPDTDFNIYPNPASDFIFLQSESNDSKIEKIRIYNIIGKLISVKQVDKISNSVDISFLPGGMYIIEAITHNSKVLDSRFIKQ